MEQINKLIDFIKANYTDYEVHNRDRKDFIEGDIYKGIGVKIPSLDFSAIWLKGSYGYEENLIEIMCPIHFSYDESVKGYLTADECIYILKNYEKLKNISQERDNMIEKTTTAINNYYNNEMEELLKGETK